MPHVHKVDRKAAFERLYLDSYNQVYGYVRTHMRSDAEAEDVVAEAYLKAARAFDSYDPTRAKFSTWVTAIAKNSMISYLRKEHPHVGLEDAPDSAISAPEDQVHVDDLLFVKQLLTCLEHDERELIALKYQQGLRNVDIAKALDMNPSTVSTKLSNAIAKMRTVAEKSR